METTSPTLFDVHHWIVSATTCDYPLLAVAQDRSALLSLGDYRLCFDCGIPDEAHHWLEQEFAPMGNPLQLDLSTIRAFVDAAFSGGAELGIVRFDEELRVVHFELGLAAQKRAEMSAEYVILSPGNYYRQWRDPEQMLPVSEAEQHMLDRCVAIFTELAKQHGELLRLPLPPRFSGDSWSLMSN